MGEQEGAHMAHGALQVRFDRFGGKLQATSRLFTTKSFEFDQPEHRRLLRGQVMGAALDQFSKLFFLHAVLDRVELKGDQRIIGMILHRLEPAEATELVQDHAPRHHDEEAVKIFRLSIARYVSPRSSERLPATHRRRSCANR